MEFDSKEYKVLNTWPLPTCEEPTGMAIDTAHKRLFIGCHSKVMLVTDYAGKVVASVPIGQGVDAASFDPATGFAFASCGDGTITVAHEDSPDKYTVVETISTQRGARTMALDTANHRVFTVTSDFGPPPAATADNPNPRPIAGYRHIYAADLRQVGWSIEGMPFRESFETCAGCACSPPLPSLNFLHPNSLTRVLVAQTFSLWVSNI